MGKQGILDNIRYPPLAIATLSAVLRNEGITPFIYDANTEHGDHFEKIPELIHRESITAIGLSFTTIFAEGAYHFADRLKREFPGLPIIAGGYHPTVMPDEVAGHPSIDYVVVGEGEVTLPSLLKVLREDGNPKDVEGLYFRHNGKISHTASRPLIPNIDNIPIPAYDMFDLNGYGNLFSTRKPFVTYVRSRGCPFRCLFCGVGAIFTRKYRCQSPQRTLEDMRFLIKSFGVKEILFKDSDFLINRKNTEEFCNLLAKEQLDILWSCNTRVDKVDDKILGLMKKAGCNRITFGIESGSQKMLNALKKDFTVEQVLKAIKLTTKNGISSFGSFTVGTPGEDRETIAETIDLLKKLDLDYASFHFLTAFPGSPLYEEAIKNNWFIDDARRPQGIEEININATKLTEDELRAAVKLMFRTFYFRPSYIMNRLMSITTPKEISNNLVGGFGLLRKAVGI